MAFHSRRVAGEGSHDGGGCHAVQGHWPHLSAGDVQCADDPHFVPAAAECTAAWLHCWRQAGMYCLVAACSAVLLFELMGGDNLASWVHQHDNLSRSLASQASLASSWLLLSRCLCPKQLQLCDCWCHHFSMISLAPACSRNDGNEMTCSAYWGAYLLRLLVHGNLGYFHGTAALLLPADSATQP